MYLCNDGHDEICYEGKDCPCCEMLKKYMRKQTKFWTTKKGVKIRICDMDDNHLLNSIKLLENKSNYLVNSIPFPCFGGEIAMEESERIYESLQENSNRILQNTIYDNLIDEAERRGLNK